MPPNATNWSEQARLHRERLAPIITLHLQRQSRHEKEPVLDFLFQYYSLRPGELLRWSPGIHRYQDEGPELPEEFSPLLRKGAEGWGIYSEDLPESRFEGLMWMRTLLERLETRPAFTGCFGLHEWAMVYEALDIRHAQLPLRLPHDKIREVVEAGPIRCSHFDAFRFFSKTARSLNRLQPTRQSRHELEQPGCLHVNMDLYKWAYKFSPWIDSDFIADLLFHALECRILDMEASPYNVQDLGYGVVPIETPEGRLEYKKRQEALARKSEPLRKQLLERLIRLQAATSLRPA